MEEFLKRYTPSQNKVIASFFAKLAVTTNKTGKMLESKKVKILQSWVAYPEQIVIDALEIYLKMNVQMSFYGKGKNEKYVLGIIKNKAVSQGGGASVRPNDGERHGGQFSSEDEGSRLQQLIGERKPTDSELECDF